MDEDDPYLLIRDNLMLLLGNAFKMFGCMMGLLVFSGTIGSCLSSPIRLLLGDIPGMFIAMLVAFLVCDAALFPRKSNPIRQTFIRSFGLHDKLSNREE